MDRCGDAARRLRRSARFARISDLTKNRIRRKIGLHQVALAPAAMCLNLTHFGACPMTKLITYRFEIIRGCNGNAAIFDRVTGEHLAQVEPEDFDAWARSHGIGFLAIGSAQHAAPGTQLELF
jgi:hypothetical protein